MIRYALLCDHEHAFEAWFRDSEAFDRQSEAGQVTCPTCGSPDVRKALMAPALRRTAARGKDAETGGAPGEGTAVSTAPQASVPVPDDTFQRTRMALRELHARLKRDAEDVGSAFPDQARRIHDGQAPPRIIYGTATNDEVRALVEDGVGILPIPSLPDDRN